MGAKTSFTVVLCVVGAGVATEAWSFASANVRMESSLSAATGLPSEQSNSGDSTAQVSQNFSQGQTNLEGSATSRAGRLTTSSRLTVFTEDWSSGGISVTSGGAFGESVLTSATNKPAGLKSLIYDFTFKAESTLVTQNLGTTGACVASVAYSLGAGTSTFNGQARRVTGTDGTTSTSSGQFGVVIGAFAVDEGSAFNVSFAAESYAFGTKNFSPFQRFDVFAHSDFSHTLQWMGVSRVRGFDASGQELLLGPDFRVSLIGQATGFDYMHAAVPEPSGLLALTAGALALLRRRRRTPGVATSGCDD